MIIKPGSIVMSLTQEKSVHQLIKLSPLCDLFEYRADRHDSVGELYSLRQLTKIRAIKPVILTARSDKEGGQWSVHGRTESERAAYVKNMAIFADVVDYEIRDRNAESVFDRIRSAGSIALGSFHNFDRIMTLEEYRKIALLGFAKGADIVKIVGPTDIDDGLDTLKDMNLIFKDFIATVALGNDALDHRIELMRNGSLMTFGHDGQNPSAPSQPSCAELQLALN